MKRLSFMALLFAMVLSFSAQSQNLNLGLYGSTGKISTYGGDLKVDLPSGVVFGVGGSHAIQSFFNKDQYNGMDFNDKNYNIAEMPYDLHQFDQINELRGSVYGSLGYRYKNTTVTADLGIAFSQNIYFYTSGNGLPPYPHGTLGYKTKGATEFLYGGTVSQQLYKRFGLLAGYNNAQNFKVGVTIQLSKLPTLKF